MVRTRSSRYVCDVCGRQFPDRELVPAAAVRNNVADLILRDHPEFTSDKFICHSDLSQYNSKYVESLLEFERGELTSLDQEVLESLRQHDLLSTNIQDEFDKGRTFGERIADSLATFGGSWPFLICFGIFLTAWIIMNSAVLYWRPVDPYPFILLNLMLSCLAAVQAPIIMMSQNRLEAKDRLRSEHDYQVNLKAELEIRHLHEKLDHLLSHQWERLVEIQQIQLEMLSQMSRR